MTSTLNSPRLSDLSCPPRFGTPRSPERKTLGRAVGIVAAMLGKPLMEWQQYVADVLLEIDPETGELVYTEWILTVPRQSGKSTFILAKTSHRCMAGQFFGEDQNVAYAAQTKLKAVEKFEKDYAAAIKVAKRANADLAAMPAVRTGNQKVDIRYPNGSTFYVEAGTEKSGHGGVLDEAYVDEAFAQPDGRLEQAFEPAMSTRRNRQLGFVSTAGWSDLSAYFLAKVEMGRALVARGVRRGVAFFEWSAPDDAEPADENVWFACMPALHRRDCPDDCTKHTIRLKTIREFYEKAVRENKLSDFCRAYLNQWKPKPREGEETALGNWAACSFRVKASELPDVAAIGISITPDRESAHIGAAGLVDSIPLVMLAHESSDMDAAAVTAGELSRDYRVPCVVDVLGPAGEAMALAIEAAGGKVVRVRTGDYVAACSGIYDRVRGGTLHHPDDPLLNDTVVGARWKTSTGKRVFDRDHSELPIAPLEAITLALHGLTRPVRKPMAAFI